jgi:hypothetical protein
VLAPLAAALLYAGASTLLRKSPSLARMVPDAAIATWRYRDLAAYVEAKTPADAVYDAGVVLATEINLPGLSAERPPLPGIDRARPLLAVTLEPSMRPDPRYFVLPVEDAAAVRDRFAHPDLKERHARSVVVHGDWAAAGWDLLTVDRAGNGRGVYPAERGELWAVAVDWPKFVDAALRPESVTTEPVRSVLSALGFDPSTGRVEEGEFRIKNPGRVPLVRDAWSRVELHAFADRVRVELWPAAQELIDALRAPPSPAAAPSVRASAPPARAQAWIATQDLRSRRILAIATAYAGMRWPLAVGRDDFAALAGTQGLLVYAEPAGGTTLSWTIVVEGAPGSLPDLAAFGLPETAVGATTPLPAGAAPLAEPFGPAASPGEIAVREKDGRRIVAIGVDARTAAERRAGEPITRPETRSEEVARFGLSHAAAQRLLGPALTKMGLLASLAGGDVEGTLSVENGNLVLEAQVTRRP